MPAGYSYRLIGGRNAWYIISISPINNQQQRKRGWDNTIEVRPASPTTRHAITTTLLTIAKLRGSRDSYVLFRYTRSMELEGRPETLLSLGGSTSYPRRWNTQVCAEPFTWVKQVMRYSRVTYATPAVQTIKITLQQTVPSRETQMCPSLNTKYPQKSMH